MKSPAQGWFGALFLSVLAHGLLLSGLTKVAFDAIRPPPPQRLPELVLSIDQESGSAAPRWPAESTPLPQTPEQVPALTNSPLSRDSFGGHESHREGITQLPQSAARPSPSIRPDLTTGAGPDHNSAPPAPGKGSPHDLRQDGLPEEQAILQDVRGRSLLMARDQVVDPFAGKRVQALSAQTRDLIFGPYAEAWRQKVEQVGALNYPAPVDGRDLHGEVRLTVTLHQDGSIALLEVRQSSGVEALDDAARRIVQMAAPFQPFTEAMRERADLISITRTFRFIRAGEALETR